MIIVFDLDGTLIDSHNLHAHILTKILLEYGIKKKISEIDVSSTSLKLFLMRFLPAEQWDKMNEIYIRYIREFSKNLNKITLMPHAVEVLESIEDKKAIFTAMSRRVALKLLELTRIKKYFDVVVAGDDVGRTKPDPEGLVLISQKMGDSDLVVVGNGENDIRAAKNFGAISIFFSPKGKVNKSADFNIKDLMELPPIIRDLKIANRRVFKL